jgi:hypothetical protein
MKITDVGEIDPSKEEGKLLMAALAIITTECRTDKTPYEVIAELNKLCEIMYIK